ncbi:methylenetetrahydrofolate reductase [Clostridia bacterium]|nr:methylenetetrahydrofolate reductase [Clostridia bacterium]GHU77685.1 methylenetetrahydrofolate reductase [Clostridia bacterium]
MRISEIFKQKRAVLSFEVFPPKKDSAVSGVYSAIDALAELSPDFISVTYGAGGSGAKTSAQIASFIKSKYGIEPLAHLTCVNSTRADIDAVLSILEENNIENILALRGDYPKDTPHIEGDFTYADSLIAYLRENYDFGISAACYPEGHPKSPNLETDIRHTKMKVDAGASHLVSQLFFDNDNFYEYVDKVRRAGITVPIEAGIMPVVSKNNILRLVSLCGATFPKKLSKMLSRYEHNPDALFDAGIAYATEQIADLLTNSVHGIHLYTMNNPLIAERINGNVRRIINSINNE